MKNKFRFLITTIAALGLLISMSVPVFAGAKEAVHVTVGGQQLEMDAVQMDNTVFLPVRSICESLGYSVEWSQENRSAAVKTPDKTVVFEFRTGTITDAGHNYYVRGYNADTYIGAGCMLIGNRIYAASDIMESCFGLSKAFDQAQNSFVLSFRPEDKATWENKVISLNEKKLMTNIQYPYFSMDDKKAAEKINSVIMADVNTAKQEARNNIEEYGNYESPNQFQTYFNYRVVYQKGDVLSIVLNDYQYFGGAHGSDRQISHTFDLKTGAEYSLSDLLKSDSEYKSYISESVKADIVKESMEDYQLVKFQSIADAQSYYLSNDGIVVYFQQYEYFPYAAGIVEFTISYADLSLYLKPEFQNLGAVN